MTTQIPVEAVCEIHIHVYQISRDMYDHLYWPLKCGTIHAGFYKTFNLQ